MRTFQLGDLVTESREPYPMTGTVVTEITRDDATTYGVRFTATADTITEVDPADIVLAFPAEAAVIRCPQMGCGEYVPDRPDEDGLIDCSHCQFLFTREQVELSMGERVAERIADIEALLADAEKMTDAQRLRAYGTLGVGLLTDKLAELKADAVSRSGHAGGVYQVVSAVECQIVSSEHGVLQTVFDFDEGDLLAVCSTYEDALWKVVDHAKRDRGFLRPTADVDRWEMMFDGRVRYGLSIRAVSPC